MKRDNQKGAKYTCVGQHIQSSGKDKLLVMILIFQYIDIAIGNTSVVATLPGNYLTLLVCIQTIFSNLKYQYLQTNLPKFGRCHLHLLHHQRFPSLPRYGGFAPNHLRQHRSVRLNPLW